MSIRTLTLALVAALVAVVLAASPRMWDEVQLATGWAMPERSGPPLLIVGHRGNIDAFPEDTAESIWSAAALAPDGIEMDVHQSASGTWYVIHDPTLDRTTNGAGGIAALSDRAIDAAEVDAGLGFDPGSEATFHVPRLETVLAGLHDFGGTIYLDLQHAESGDPASLLQVADGLRVAVLCRSAAEAAAIKHLAPGVQTLLHVTHPVGPGVDELLGDASLHASLRLMATWPLPITVYVDASQVNDNEYELLRLAWAGGVTAFISNHLEGALETRDQFAASEP